MCDLSVDPTCAFDRRAAMPLATQALFRRYVTRDVAGRARPEQREPATLDSEISAVLNVWGATGDDGDVRLLERRLDRLQPRDPELHGQRLGGLRVRVVDAREQAAISQRAQRAPVALAGRAGAEDDRSHHHAR